MIEQEDLLRGEYSPGEVWAAWWLLVGGRVEQEQGLREQVLELTTKNDRRSRRRSTEGQKEQEL